MAGAHRITRLESGLLDSAAFIDAITAGASGDAGAQAVFIGRVRGGDGVKGLELQHYEALTLPGMEALANEADARFDCTGLGMIHRIGFVHPGEAIVCVVAMARHRRAAIEAVDFCMDHLKSAAWFWKRELRADGWHWIEPRAADHADRERWKKSPSL